MVSYKCLIYLTVVVAVVTQLHAACVCNEKGSDYCAACSGRQVVRPKHKYSEVNSKIDLSPIGDTCWCSKTMIEPASLPKPCSKEKKSSTCGCKGSDSTSVYSKSSSSSSYDSLPSIYSSSHSSGSYIVPQVNYVSTARKDDSLPADPISISLAIQAGKAIEVPEAKLSYGFVQKPIDGLPKVYMSSVLEENLYALKNDVITLKKQSSASTKSCQKQMEDYAEHEEEESKSDNDDAYEDEARPSLTYKQLGYETEQFKNPQFQDIRNSYSYSSEYSQPSVVPGKFSADCGYKPGRIAKYRRTNNYDIY